MLWGVKSLTIYYESFVDPSCCSRISRATRLFITTRTSSSTNISSEPPPPSPFVSTVFTLKQNRMDLNCFSIVYMTIDIDVHINLLFQTWWCHRQRQSGKQIHNCCKSGMLKFVKHWFCIKYSINVLGVDLNYKLTKFQGKCKIVSDFQGRRSETRPDRIRKMFHPEIEEAFPLYTTMKKIRAMDPCPRK